ncbi:MAG: septum formation initiator family protein [Clostridia bacterium]|nr:septum formation initiator family protein [Clostridia bacterium]
MSRKNSNFFVKLFLAILFVFVVANTINLRVKINALSNTKAEIERQIKIYSLKVEEINEKLSAPVDRDYIIRLAREKLGYSLPNEIIFYNDLMN